MYNTDLPDREQLPSAERLIKSTIIALLVAAAILVTIVMPAEYAIDPTGIGTRLGLTDMGEIKAQLEQEAIADAALQRRETLEQNEAQGVAEPQALTECVEPSTAVSAKAEAETAPFQEPESQWKDELSFTLSPGQGREYKLLMEKGMVANFSWKSDAGAINYDKHGNGSGQKISYKKGRGIDAEEGQLVAAFTGRHGWFFRNRNEHDVTVTLKLGGEYTELKRVY